MHFPRPLTQLGQQILRDGPPLGVVAVAAGFEKRFRQADQIRMVTTNGLDLVERDSHHFLLRFSFPERFVQAEGGDFGFFAHG